MPFGEVDTVSHRNAGALVEDDSDAEQGSIWYADENGTAVALPPPDAGNDYHLVYLDGAEAPSWEIDGGGGGGGDLAVIYDEGSAIAGAPHDELNFVGAGVTVTNAGSGRATITIPITYPTIKDENVAVSGSPHSIIDFAGAGVSVADGGGGRAIVTIAGNTSETLQQTYDAGAGTIAVSAAKAVALSNAVDSTDLLTLARTFAGAGDALDITLGTSATGVGAYIRRDNLAVSSANRDIGGIVLDNQQAATDGNPQYSPALRVRSRAWNPSGTPASNWVEWALYHGAIQGNSDPHPTLRFALAYESQDYSTKYVDSLFGDASVAFSEEGFVHAKGFGFPQYESASSVGLGYTYIGPADPANEVTLKSDGLMTLTSVELMSLTGDTTTEIKIGTDALYPDDTEVLGKTSNRWDYLYGERIDLDTGSAVKTTKLHKVTAGTNVEQIEHHFVLGTTAFAGFAGAEETGTIASQRAVYFEQPTYTSTTGVGTLTLTDAATVTIKGAPIDGGAGIVLTNPWSLLVESGASKFAGAITVTGAATMAAVSGTTGTFSGAVSGTTGTFSGAISGTTGTFSGQVSGPTGSAGTPSFSPAANMGMYSGGTSLNLSYSSAARMEINATAITMNEPVWLTGITDDTVGDLRLRGRTSDPSAVQNGEFWYLTSGLLKFRAGSAATRTVPFVDSTNGNAWTGNQYTTPVALTDGANIATNAFLGNVFTVTLAGNRTLDFPSNVAAGMTFHWIITQDGTGSRTLNTAAFDWGLEGAPTLSTGAGKIDVISGVALSTSVIRCSFNKAAA